LAAIQEKLLDKTQGKLGKVVTTGYSTLSSKSDSKSTFSPGDMWKAHQLTEHRRANGLCFKCEDKYTPGHKCADTASDGSVAQLASITGHNGDGGALLRDEMFSALEVHFASTEDDCYISLNAIAGTQNNRVIHLRALVNNQVLSILVDSGSSHTFLNAAMLHRLDYKVTTVPKMTVKVANGDIVYSDREAKDFQWWIQGHTFKKFWTLQHMTLFWVWTGGAA
jgi:hypothetical protein